MYVLIIAINYAPEATGIAPYTTALAQGLHRRGHRVRVLTAMPHYPEWRFRAGYEGWTRRETLDGVEVVRLRHRLPRKPIGVGRLISELVFGLRVLLADWQRPDAVLLTSPALFSTAVAMLRPGGGARAVWVQDLYSLGVLETGGTSRAADVVHRVESWVLRRADGVMVIHERFAEIVERLGARRSQIRVIRNWTHIRRRPSAERRQAVRRRMGWGADDVIALHTGNMGVKQGLDNVLEAAALAERRGSRVRFVLAGGGSERDRLHTLATERRLAAVEFVESVPRDEYAAMLAAADVLVLNERTGLRDMALPSKLTSYFAAGRPVVAATAPDSLAGIELERAGAGLRVDPADPADLLDAVERLGSDPATAAVSAARGVAYSRRELDEDRAVDAVESWLESLADGSRRDLEYHRKSHTPLSRS